MINGQVRHCIPIHDCSPGFEILPCTEPYTKDRCDRCATGFVQPEYISSSNDANLTKCFKPLGQCSAHDVIDSRTSNTNSCLFNKYCQCKTTACYYGDPCRCDMKRCKAGTTLNKLGECVECPPGTKKDEDGCGPCKSITKDERTTKDSTITTNVTTESSGTVVVTTERPRDNTLMTVVVILSVVMVLGTATLIILIIRRQFHQKIQEVAVDQLERGQLIEQPPNEDDYQDHLSNLDEVQNINQCASSENKTLSSRDGILASKQLNNCSEPNTSSHVSSMQALLQPSNCGNSVTNMPSLPVDIMKIMENRKVVPSNELDCCLDSQPVNGISGGDRNSSTADVNYNVVSDKLEQKIPGIIHVRSSNSNENKNNLNMPHSIQLNVSSFATTEVCSSPVAQETNVELIHQNMGCLQSDQRSSFSDNDDLHCSPMSEKTTEGQYQEYYHLVSASDRNTESMITCLENYNFNLVCDNSTTVAKHSTTSKFIDSRLQSVDESSKEM